MTMNVWSIIFWTHWGTGLHFTNFLYNTPEKNSLCPEENSLRLKGNEEARRETIYY
jgi:hypothetical protein